MTPSDLIRLALKSAGVIGVGQTASAEDTTDAFLVLNAMLATWNRRRWLIPNLVDWGLKATGKQNYTVGPLGDFNIDRPDEIHAAYVRQNGTGSSVFYTPPVGIGGGLPPTTPPTVPVISITISNGVNSTGGSPFAMSFGQFGSFGANLMSTDPDDPDEPIVLTNTVDYPLAIIKAREDYSSLSLKNITGFPSMIFYDSAYPFGHLYVWPIPDQTYEIHIVIKETLTQFSNLAEPINLPGEYIEALFFSLAVRLRPLYGFPPDPSLIGLATQALNVIRTTNAQIPRLAMPPALSGNRRWMGHGMTTWGQT